MERPLWRMIKTEPLSGAMNMALDEVQLQSVQAGTSPPVVRLYRWQLPTVSLEYGQRGAEQVNVGHCKEEGIDVVRRSRDSFRQISTLITQSLLKYWCTV